MKKIRYSVRYFENDSSYSKTVGFKMRVLPRRQALRVCRRLKRAGVQAIAAPMSVAL